MITKEAAVNIFNNFKKNNKELIKEAKKLDVMINTISKNNPQIKLAIHEIAMENLAKLMANKKFEQIKEASKIELGRNIVNNNIKNSLQKHAIFENIKLDYIKGELEKALAYQMIPKNPLGKIDIKQLQDYVKPFVKGPREIIPTAAGLEVALKEFINNTAKQIARGGDVFKINPVSYKKYGVELAKPLQTALGLKLISNNKELLNKLRDTSVLKLLLKNALPKNISAPYLLGGLGLATLIGGTIYSYPEILKEVRQAVTPIKRDLSLTTDNEKFKKSLYGAGIGALGTLGAYELGKYLTTGELSFNPKDIIGLGLTGATLGGITPMITDYLTSPLKK